MTHDPIPCTSIECPRPATHYARRFGPESPYCRPCACWADGISPTVASRDLRLAPLPLVKSSTGQPQVVTLG